MLGLVCYRDGKEKNGTRMLYGVRFYAVYIERGEGLHAHLSAKRAVRWLRRHRVCHAIFPCEYPFMSVFVRAGILPPDELPLRMAKAAEIIQRAMDGLGILPERAHIALFASAPNAALEAVASKLAETVRYLTLRAPDNARIARALRWDSGVSVREAGAGEEICADLAVSFDASAPMCRCPLLPLAAQELQITYGFLQGGEKMEAWERRQLFAALFLAGSLQREDIFVKMVDFSLKTGETANLP